MSAVRVAIEDGVGRITLNRPEAYNTITPEMRDALDAALTRCEHNPDVRVVLLDAAGPAFCAGYGLDWATPAQAASDGSTRAWDTPADLAMIGRFNDVWHRLHSLTRPTIAAVQGWCIAGGTNIAFCADMIVAADDARFGYPPSRVWGVPEAPWTWVARMGLERAKRMMLTGDEFTGAQAAEWGIILEAVPADDLADHALALARRMAQVPLNQLQMIKWSLNGVARQMYDPEGSRQLGMIFDGVARHSQEGRDFVQRSQEVGFREAVRERDRPFGDYGERGTGDTPDGV